MKYIVDAYAWIEYFLGTKKAIPFRKLLLDAENEFITAECTVAEIRLWSLRNQLDFDEFFRIVQANSTIPPVTFHDWLDAATARQEMRRTRQRFGLLDAILLVKQRKLGCKLISGDPHFEGLPHIIFMA